MHLYLFFKLIFTWKNIVLIFFKYLFLMILIQQYLEMGRRREINSSSYITKKFTGIPAKVIQKNLFSFFLKGQKHAHHITIKEWALTWYSIVTKKQPSTLPINSNNGLKPISSSINQRMILVKLIGKTCTSWDAIFIFLYSIPWSWSWFQ